MKFPYSMLKDFVRTRLDAEQAGDLLTMAGFELEGIEQVEGDSVLDIKVMSNRGDGLSVFGQARELYAKDPEATPTQLFFRAAERFPSTNQGSLELAENAASIECGECKRFCIRAFENIPLNAQAPQWIRDRLERSGIRTISLLVDLTNYVMLEIGQPLHAFDRDKLSGGRIVVRNARAGERLTTLNGEEHELDGQMMICDAERPVGVPGVMGGLDTEVTEQTARVLLESANFLNTNVRRTRKQLGLSTEASYRFERSVDPESAPAAIRRFTELLLEVAPQAKFSNIVDRYPEPLVREAITLRPERASKLLGMKIPYPDAVAHLQRLGMGLEEDGLTFSVTPPTWRPDLIREEDLIEELGRIHGYERIPERLLEGSSSTGGAHGFSYWVDRLREEALRHGFVQTISHSLRDQHPLDSELIESTGPRNPASPDMAFLRNSVLPSLADAARRNGGKALNLFEVGRVFGKVGGCFWEGDSIGFLSTDGGFFDLKGGLADALAASGIVPDYVAPSPPDLRLHPTRQAAIIANGVRLGVLGQLHPDLAAELDLPASCSVAELDLNQSFENRANSIELKPVSRFPSVRRDISILIPKEVPYQRISTAIAESGGDVLEKQWLFDIYTGKGIPEDSHSLAIALQLRKLDGTFTDEEANQVRERIVAALAGLGAILR
jgi:phenylalanyl-tRNA synthetase beta chain